MTDMKVSATNSPSKSVINSELSIRDMLELLHVNVEVSNRRSLFSVYEKCFAGKVYIEL